MNSCPFADFNDLGIPVKGTTTACSQYWLFLECLGQDFAWDANPYRSAARFVNNGDAHLHLLLTKKEEPTWM